LCKRRVKDSNPQDPFEPCRFSRPVPYQLGKPSVLLTEQDESSSLLMSHLAFVARASRSWPHGQDARGTNPRVLRPRRQARRTPDTKIQLPQAGFEPASARFLRPPPLPLGYCGRNSLPVAATPASPLLLDHEGDAGVAATRVL